MEDCIKQWQDYKAGKGPKPSITFISLCKLYMQSKQKLSWLRELSATVVRYSRKPLAEAYKRYFDGAGHPDWKRKYKTTPKFTVPQDVKTKGKQIYIPKIGWVRLTGQSLLTAVARPSKPRASTKPGTGMCPFCMLYRKPAPPNPPSLSIQ